MLRLLYSSQAAPAVTDDQVGEIQRVSQRNNPSRGLTGVLVSGGGMFMQVLEGPEEAVLRQYVKILDDRRHANCRLIYISPANERQFSSWSMGLVRCKPLEFQHIMQIGARRQETVELPAFTAAMRAFLARLDAAKD